MAKPPLPEMYRSEVDDLNYVIGVCEQQLHLDSLSKNQREEWEMDLRSFRLDLQQLSDIYQFEITPFAPQRHSAKVIPFPQRKVSQQR